jgi:LEA14-like dessication related protein
MLLARTRSIALRLPLWIALAALCLSFPACVGLGRVFERPQVRVLGVDVAKISLESADLVFDVSVENPNALSFILDTVDYRLRINGEQLLDGQSALRAEIAARGATEVQLPITLRFTDILRILGSLKGERHAGYDLQADVWFSVPVAGRLSVPVRKKGDFSLDDIRLPL